MFFRNFRILPLLIFVAMLAFSVRLADVAISVSALSGEARAADEKTEESHGGQPAADKPEEVTTAAQNEPDPDALSGSMDKDKKGVLEFPESKNATEPVDKGAEKSKDTEAAQEEDDKPIGWQSPTDMDMDFSKSRKDLGDDLAKRREELERRERELQTKEALLKAGEQELERKFQELSQLRGQIENLLQRQSEEESARVASLVKIYEGMKPADAARIFDTLDLDVLVSVMSSMSERKLSPVMAAMNPERAKTITIMLAQQKQLPQLPESQ